MPWLTDPIAAVSQQLSGMGADIDPSVLARVNQATREATQPQFTAAPMTTTPAQFTAGAQAQQGMQNPQFSAAQPNFASGFQGPQDQFFAGNNFGTTPQGSAVGGFLAKDMGNQPWQINLARPPSATGAVPGGGGTGATSVAGGQWATLDGMNGYIDQAAAQTGVPANLIKSMLAREGAFGTDRNVVPLRGEYVYAFNGIFQSTAQSRGIDFQRMTQDDAYAVWAMGEVLRQIKQENGFQTWDDVAGYYFAGPNYQNDNWGDETGENTVWNYKYGPSGVITRWQELDQMSGTSAGTGAPVDWNSVISGGALYDWGEFGVDSDNGYYGYGTQYGLNGRQHTGADVAAPRGSQYRAPMGGQVMCAGTGNGTAADGSACAAFADINGGAGRVEILLDNGAVLIFGHSSQAFVRPGQRVEAGQVLGAVGTYNSDHVHLEARVRDPNTPSGWRIVDPRTVMGGGSFGGAGFGGGASNSKFFGQGSSFVDFLLG